MMNSESKSTLEELIVLAKGKIETMEPIYTEDKPPCVKVVDSEPFVYEDICRPFSIGSDIVDRIMLYNHMIGFRNEDRIFCDKDKGSIEVNGATIRYIFNKKMVYEIDGKPTYFDALMIFNDDHQKFDNSINLVRPYDKNTFYGDVPDDVALAFELMENISDSIDLSYFLADNA